MRKLMTATLMLTLAGCNSETAQEIEIPSRHTVHDATDANRVLAMISEGVIHPVLFTIGGPGAPGSADTPVVVENRNGAGTAVVTGRPQIVDIDGLDWHATRIDAQLTLEFQGWHTTVGAWDITLVGAIRYERHSLETHYASGQVTEQIQVAMSGSALAIDCNPILDRIAFDTRNVSNEAGWFTGSLTNSNGDRITF